MKKAFLTTVILALALAANAQVNVWDETPDLVAEQREDNAPTRSLNEVLNTQRKASNTAATTDHYNNVWNRRTYLNFGYNSTKATLTSAPKLDAALEGGQRETDWGFAFTVGTNYRLHKPIANMVSINLDYNSIEFNANHYKQMEGSHYNSATDYRDIDGNQVLIRPWGEEMYEFNYGMSVGPSVTVTPFTTLGKDGLDFIKANIYFHVGYNASLIYRKVKDENPDEKSTLYQLLDEAKPLDFGHGLFTSFGFNLSWKAIGVGYERRTGTNKYKAISTKEFGGDEFKMKSEISRVYLQIRM